MTKQEFKSKIDRIKSMIATQTAKTKTEEQFQELTVLGLDIIGEFFGIKNVFGAYGMTEQNAWFATCEQIAKASSAQLAR